MGCPPWADARRRVAEISPPHLGVRADFIGTARRDDLATQQDEDSGGVAEHHIHVVLGEQHADPARASDVLREFHQGRPLAQGHPGRRLVHQQKPRVARQRDRELDPLHIPVGELRTGPVGRSRHAHLIEKRHRQFTVPLPCGMPHRQDFAAMADQRHLDVLADRHGMKRLGDLKCTADAPAKPLLRGGEGDNLALE